MWWQAGQEGLLGPVGEKVPMTWKKNVLLYLKKANMSNTFDQGCRMTEEKWPDRY